MTVEHQKDNIYIKEKFNGQTYEIGFNINKGKIINLHLYFQIYSKRKHADKEMDDCVVTGKDPFYTVQFAIDGLQALENYAIDYYDRPCSIYVFWTDSRRRDAYYKFLSKRGYQFGKYDAYKCLVKKLR